MKVFLIMENFIKEKEKYSKSHNKSPTGLSLKNFFLCFQNYTKYIISMEILNMKVILKMVNMKEEEKNLMKME